MGLHIDIQKKLQGFKLQVSLSCGQEIIGILGASGSGKSMLLNCVAGLVKPDEGLISLNGRSFYDSVKRINLPSRDRKTGFLFQNYALFPHLTIRDNIAFGLDVLTKPERDQKVAELLERFHLAGTENRYPSQISGGQQQRVSLARAMAIEPDILLLDEPFSALDEHLKNHMLEEMKVYLKEFRGSTLFVTHNIEEAYRLCDRIAVFSAGHVEKIDLKREVFSNPGTVETARITGCKNITGAVRKSEYWLEVPKWNIHLKTGLKIEEAKGFVGIRANHIKLAYEPNQENTFPVWIADESEAPFRTSLYLKFGLQSDRSDDYDIQWEISRELREDIRKLPQPFHISLPSANVFFMKS